MKKLLIGLGLLLPILLSAQQVPRSLTAANGQLIGFYEYKPPTYNSGAKQPLIIFLHGIGERGDGTSTLSSVLNVGIPRNIHYGLTDMVFNYNGTQQGFLVLSPQLSYNYGNWQPFYIEEMVKYAKANLNVDPNRIYLTGLSLGGGGVWRYATSSAAAAQNLAAIAPICGTCDFTNFGNIAQNNVAVWAFHAMDDGVVGVGCTQTAVNQVNSQNPAIPAIATYYPTGNHWIWDQVYDPQNPQLYLWFLSKSRGTTPPPTGGNVAPVANAGNAQTITLPNNSVNLSGSGSYDQDGTITQFTWSQVSGPSTGSIVNPNVSNTSVGGLIAGSYVFKLTIKDNAGASASANVTITVNAQAAPSNQPPVAATSGNQTITLPANSVFLLGSGSYDPGGGYITNYAWTQESGPNTASTTVISNTNLDVKNLIAGTYVFKLTVTDNQGATGSSTVQVTVNGQAAAAPVANAGTNQSMTLPTNSTTLNGSASSGSIASYAWTQVSGPNQATFSNAAIASPSVSNMIAGTYVFRLTVKNAAGTASSADVQVVVNNAAAVPGNQAPVAVPGANQSLTLPTNSLFLFGSGSYDPGGGYITNYAWSQQSGPSNATINVISNTNVEVKDLIAGTYVFKLTVTDNQGATNSATMQVTVTGSIAPPPPTGNQAPVAVPGSNQTITLPTNSLFLYGSGSYDQGSGYITDYAWSQVSGPNTATLTEISSTNVEIKNLVAGTYVFTLTVTDNQGATGSANVQVTVNGAAAVPGNTPPTAVAGATQYITLPTSAVYLMGGGSYDPGGWIASFAWSQVSGPNSATMTVVSPSNVEAKNLVAGTYTFRLTVTDNQGATGTSTMQVVVSSSGARIASSSDGSGTTSATATLVSNTSSIAAVPEKTVMGNNSISLYPNPVTTTLNVQLNNELTGVLQINVVNAAGIAVKSIRTTKTSAQFTQQVNMQDVAQGTYVVEIRFADGTRLSGQVVKK
jgi:predicted esterase